MSYRRPHFGLLDDISKVEYGNNTSFTEYQMTFWLAFPTWFRNLSNISVSKLTSTSCGMNKLKLIKLVSFTSNKQKLQIIMGACIQGVKSTLQKGKSLCNIGKMNTLFHRIHPCS